MGSRLQALVQLANTGLTLNPVMKFAYLIPRNVKVADNKWETRCFLEPSYMGLIKAATDTGSIKLMRGEIVYQGDDCDFLKGTTVSVRHIPYWKTGRERGGVVAAYSVAILHDGTVDVLDMGPEDLGKVKNASEAVKNNRKSPHDNWAEEMMRKAPIRRHLKTLPKTDRMESLMHAVAADEEQFAAEPEKKALPEAMTELEQIRQEVYEKMPAYIGRDKSELEAQCRDAVRNKRDTVEFWHGILAQIEPPQK